MGSSLSASGVPPLRGCRRRLGLIPVAAAVPAKRVVGAKCYEKDSNITHLLVDAAAGLCRHACRFGGGFSWLGREGDDLWRQTASGVEGLFNKNATTTCMVPSAAFGQGANRDGE